MNGTEEENLLDLDYSKLINGKPSIQINYKRKDIFISYFSNPHEIIRYAQNHGVYGLYFKDNVYVDGKPAFGKCETDPPSIALENNSHESYIYKITLKAKIDFREREKEIEKTKKELGIEIAHDEFYYWLFFHELGHTYKASDAYHAGALQRGKSDPKEFKPRQEKLAKEYCRQLFKKWKTNNLTALSVNTFSV